MTNGKPNPQVDGKRQDSPKLPWWETVLIVLCVAVVILFFIPMDAFPEWIRFAAGGMAILIMAVVLIRRTNRVRGMMGPETVRPSGPRNYHKERQFSEDSGRH